MGKLWIRWDTAMIIWKIESEDSYFFKDYGLEDDGEALFKKKADANKWMRILYNKWAAEEKSEYGDDVATFKEFVADHDLKVKKVKVRTDAKTERVILQSK